MPPPAFLGLTSSSFLSYSASEADANLARAVTSRRAIPVEASHADSSAFPVLLSAVGKTHGNREIGVAVRVAGEEGDSEMETLRRVENLMEKSASGKLEWAQSEGRGEDTGGVHGSARQMKACAADTFV